jgi:hypothetical protein
MHKTDCLLERVSHILVGSLLLLIAAGLSLIGVTILPLLGLIAAAPVLFLAVYFFKAPRSRECFIS